MRFWTFPQRDEPWASKPLDDSGLTCAGYGCFACSIAAVFKFFGKDEDPAKFIDWMNDNGGFDKNGMLNVSTAGNRYTDIDFIERIDCENSPAPIDKINSYLAQGIPVIAKLWFSKAGGYTHFVTIQDGDGSDYLIGDPWYGDERWLNSTSHGSGTPAERILGIRVFKKTSQDPPPPPPPPSCDCTAQLNTQADEFEKETSKLMDEHDVFVATAQAEMEKRDDIITACQSQILLLQDEIKTKKQCPPNPSMEYYSAWELVGLAIKRWLKI